MRHWYRHGLASIATVVPWHGVHHQKSEGFTNQASPLPVNRTQSLLSLKSTLQVMAGLGEGGRGGSISGLCPQHKSCRGSLNRLNPQNPKHVLVLICTSVTAHLILFQRPRPTAHPCTIHGDANKHVASGLHQGAGAVHGRPISESSHLSIVGKGFGTCFNSAN